MYYAWLGKKSGTFVIEEIEIVSEKEVPSDKHIRIIVYKKPLFQNNKSSFISLNTEVIVEKKHIFKTLQEAKYFIVKETFNSTR